jgi:hypothetical protein
MGSTLVLGVITGDTSLTVAASAATELGITTSDVVAIKKAKAAILNLLTPLYFFIAIPFVVYFLVNFPTPFTE